MGRPGGGPLDGLHGGGGEPLEASGLVGLLGRSLVPTFAGHLGPRRTRSRMEAWQWRTWLSTMVGNPAIPSGALWRAFGAVGASVAEFGPLGDRIREACRTA